MPVDYSPEAIDARLHEVSRLNAERKAKRKPVDYSPEAITRRLLEVEQLRRLCIELGKSTLIDP